MTATDTKGIDEMLDGRRERQIFQTVTCRLDDGKKGPPDSYTDEEKKFYAETENEILENRRNGRIVNYHFPNDYD